MPQPDNTDDLSALDFGSYESGSDDNGHGSADALDFSANGEDTPEESDAEALDAFVPPEPEEDENELDAIAAASETDDEEDDGTFTVTNPFETVSVSAWMDGSTFKVTLSKDATKHGELGLAEEIVVLADLARKKGLAGQHTFLSENASEIEGLDALEEVGVDRDTLLRELMQNAMHLPTADEAEAEQAEVFAARYAPDK